MKMYEKPKLRFEEICLGKALQIRVLATNILTLKGL